jgi:hypothetical protein
VCGGAQQRAAVHGSGVGASSAHSTRIWCLHLQRQPPSSVSGTHGIAGLDQLAPLDHKVHSIAPPKLVPARRAAVPSGPLVINLQGLTRPPQLHHLLHSLSQLYGCKARCALLPPVAGEAGVGVLQQGADLVCRSGKAGMAGVRGRCMAVRVLPAHRAWWQQQAGCTP